MSVLSTIGLRERIAAFMGFSHQGNRDLYESFGYPRVLLAEDFYALYKRNDIASRIIRAFPQATWREFPCVHDEAGKTDEDSTFVASVNELLDKFQVQQALERVDRVSSIGRYGILVMGFQDGLELSQPLGEGKKKLLYLQPYGEYNVTVTKWETNVQSPRYGRPVLYTVNTGSPDTENAAPNRSFTVHWTRTVHLSEFLDEDDIFGQPRLQPCYNRLKDMEKVVGGSAETFWLTANRGLALWADKEANLSDDEIDKIKEQADEFQHQLRRYVVGQGMQAQVLGSDTPDPQPNVETLLDLIAGAVGIPKRILIGSERGELASVQDENNWFARIDERRTNFATPSIIRPFVDTMIATGNIEEPQGKYEVVWPEIGALGPAQEADILTKKTTALATYVAAPGADLLVTPEEFRVDFLGMEPQPIEDLMEDEELFGPEPELEEPEEGTDDEESSNVLPLQS